MTKVRTMPLRTGQDHHAGEFDEKLKKGVDTAELHSRTTSHDEQEAQSPGDTHRSGSAPVPEHTGTPHPS